MDPSPFECPICTQTLESPVSLPCAHNFCLERCLSPWYAAVPAAPSCPLCRHPLPPLASLKVNRTVEAGIALLQRVAAPRPPPLRAVDPALLTVLPAPLLGEGTFGRVQYGTYDGVEVAVKVLQLDARDAAAEVVAGFRREAAFLCELSHPNILRVFGVVEGGAAPGAGGGGGAPALSLVVELAEGGSLEGALRSGAGPPHTAAARRRAPRGAGRGARARVPPRAPPPRCAQRPQVGQRAALG